MNTPHSLSQTAALSPTGGQSLAGTTGNRPRNSCHRCGATAYRYVIERDGTGVMRPSGRYQCVQCKQVFQDVKDWREGVSSLLRPSGDSAPLMA